MTKQPALCANMEYPSDIPEDIRETFIRQFEEWDVEQQQQNNMENTALFSEDELEQLNTAVESVADKLGIRGELATIDALLKARSTRAARILTAAYREQDFRAD